MPMVDSLREEIGDDKNARMRARLTLPLFWAGIAIVCVVGVVSRFTHLDRAVYWHDEAITSLWLSGHSYEDLINGVFTGREIGIADLATYQHVPPGHKLTDTIAVAARGEPQTAPLYLMLLSVWVNVFGDSVVAIRSLSAVFSLLSLLAICWLSVELFRSRLTASVAVGLLSISPFHIAYAQEARSYSLWTLTIVLSTAALLRALRQPTRESWLLYALTAALAMYSHILSGAIIVAHGVYVIGVQERRGRGWAVPTAVQQYAFAIVVATTLFAPWAGLMALQRGRAYQALGWVTHDFGQRTRFMSWGGGLIRNYFDVGWSERDVGQSAGITAMLCLIGVFLACLIGLAFHHAWRHQSKRVWLLLLLLTGSASLVLVVPDLVFGGQRSMVPRYLIPSYVGALLAVASLLATHVFSPRRGPRLVAQLSLAIVLLGGIASAVIDSQSADRWTKGDQGRHCLRVAAAVNAANHPLLIDAGSFGNILTLSRLLEPQVRLQLLYRSEELKVAGPFSTIFLFEVPASVRTTLREQLNVEFELIDESAGLWRSVHKGG